MIDPYELEFILNRMDGEWNARFEQFDLDWADRT